MQTITKTIKGWANNSDLLCSPNVKNNNFHSNLKEYENTHLKGFKELSCFQTLKGKNATTKVVIKGWYWRGSWASPTKETVSVYYK